MRLVLSSAFDLAARWAYEGLRDAGGSVRWITEDLLATVQDWDHRIGTKTTSTSFKLADGTVIRSRDIDGVLNRFSLAAQIPFLPGSGSERDYCRTETSAFFLSWIYSLQCRVLNPPTPQGLAGRWRHASEWALLAQKAGLSTAPYRHSDRNTTAADTSPLSGNVVVAETIVLGGELFGTSVPRETGESCLRLAELSGTPLIGIGLTPAQGGTLVFSHTNLLPDLRIGGTGLLRQMRKLFRSWTPP